MNQLRYLIFGFWWYLYPSDAGAWIGLAATACVVLLVVALVMRRYQVVRLLAAFVIAYIATVFSMHVQYEVTGLGPYSDQLVAASGRPFTMFSDDAGMTDDRAREWGVVGNIVFYFLLALAVLRPKFRRLFR